MGTHVFPTALDPFPRSDKYMSLQHATMHCNTLQHTATVTVSLISYNTIHEFITACALVYLQAATHCNTLQHTATVIEAPFTNFLQPALEYIRKLRQIATDCNRLQQAATDCTTLQ